MADGPRYPHLWVRDRVENRDFSRKGGGNPKVRGVEWRAHGRARKAELDEALRATDEERRLLEMEEKELAAIGTVVVLEGADADYPLKTESLEAFSRHTTEPKRPYWLLLSVDPPLGERPERAKVWVSDEYRASFLKKFEDYLEKTTEKGNRRNRELVANVGRIRAAVTADLWQSAGAPPGEGSHWWEIWLKRSDDGVELLAKYARGIEARLAEEVMKLPDRTVTWLYSTWQDLQTLPFTSVPLAEIRRPEFAEAIEALDRGEREELVESMAERVVPAPNPDAPAVCHLDTGVRRSHVLLSDSLAESDLHTIVGTSGADVVNHGTPMAGLALYGSLGGLLSGTAAINLRHRLESVKMLPDAGDGHDRSVYGLVTAQAVSMPEAVADRPRVFCMPITAEPDLPGEPSLWSASVDALAAGVGIGRADDGISLLGKPDPTASRLFVISAGNVREYEQDYLAVCDLNAIEDPAHAWNALTVGAFTELDQPPTHPDFAGWSALAPQGELSPHSRTSLTFGSRTWPLKPDICMEGGNIITDGAEDFDNSHPALSLPTTDCRDDLALSSANATSAATAQAARLAALTQATYPEYWPETVRGLLVHGAEWTAPMRGRIDGAPNQTEKLTLLRRYGWGVPDEAAVLHSARNAVTMVTQDEFVPFQGDEFKSRIFRLHRLPWPTETLEELGAADVTLRVTLSYFIEPRAARRGWRSRYAYPSHSLRFELKGRTETTDQFLDRINRAAQDEEEGNRPGAETGRWVVGPNQRNLGSLHQDLWEGSGADLARSGVLAVNPVGGWWKNNKHKDRIDQGVRYALIVSLRTAEQGVDLYTPISTQLELPVEEVVLAT